MVLEEGELRIEFGHPYRFSSKFTQETVHTGDNHIVRLSAVTLGWVLESTEMRHQSPVVEAGRGD